MNDDDVFASEGPYPIKGRTTAGFQARAPWWYRLLARLWPSRCREIPEADNPTWCEHKDPAQEIVRDALLPAGSCRQCGAPPRIVLRQFALIKRFAYLQNFGCAEDPRYMHSHPFRFMIAIGLWGSYTERRVAGASFKRSAPYVYTLDSGHVHHVQNVSAGHTSIFIGFGRAEDGSEGDKRYFGSPVENDYATEAIGSCSPGIPITFWSSWKQHIRRKVARI